MIRPLVTRTALTLALCAPVVPLVTGAAQARDGAAGLPFHAIQNGDVQPRHTSPIAQFEAFRGPGLDGARPPGMGVRPVAPFLPRLRQHRDAGPLPIMPLLGTDRAPGNMPYRNDHVRLPAGSVETLRRSARPLKAGVGYAGPGTTVDGFVQGTVRTPDFYARAFARAADAGDTFDDGAGTAVPFGYEQNSQQLVLGYTPTPGAEIFGVLVRDRTEQDKTPSAGLDNIETDRIVGRAGVEMRQGLGALDRLRVEVRMRDGERTNNNFGVRDFVVGPGNRRVQVENERQRIDGRLFGDFDTGPVTHRLGVDWLVEQRDGDRFVDLTASAAEPTLDGLGAKLFPDIFIGEVGPTWEAAYSASENDHLRLGLGYRVAIADADDTDAIGDGAFGTLAPGLAASPANAYDFYYGEVDERQTDHLFNARLLYQRELLDDRLTLFGEVAKIDRAADSKERFWAGLTPPAAAANRLIGNPELDPERHHQTALGARLDGEDWLGFGRARATGAPLLTQAWSLSGAVRYSHVEDFITRDRARLQAGIAQDDGALIFRNVNVDMVAFEIDGQINLTPRLAARANLAATYAENTSDDRPLYGVAPLEANLLVEYSDRLGTIGDWALGGKLRLVADQTRVDADPATGAGFDEGKTDDFQVLDLYADVQFYDRIALRLGVENVLDETYREHVARDTLDFRQRARVNAPGRTVFLRGLVSF